MSIKTILVLTSLSLILSSQHTMVQAAYPPSGIVEQHDIEAAQSMKSMKLLLDHNQGIVPLSEFEPKSSMKNLTLTTQEALDKQEIAGMSASSLVSTELQDEITNYQFARRIGFTFIGIIAEERRNSLKMESWLESIEKYLEKVAPYLDNYGRANLLD